MRRTKWSTVKLWNFSPGENAWLTPFRGRRRVGGRARRAAFWLYWQRTRLGSARRNGRVPRAEVAAFASPPLRGR
eukprot:4719009-Alexandrium_andersonii.AAC.1